MTFLRARLDEDEQWALAASSPFPYATGDPQVPDAGVNWEWVTGDNWDPVQVDPLEEYVADGDVVRLASREEWPSSGYPMRATASEGIQEVRTGAAGHIVRHDPARVLRQVEAKRRIVDDYEFAERRVHDGPSPAGPEWNLGYRQAAFHAACVLAMTYADHEDFREEWGPV